MSPQRNVENRWKMMEFDTEELILVIYNFKFHTIEKDTIMTRCTQLYNSEYKDRLLQYWSIVSIETLKQLRKKKNIKTSLEIANAELKKVVS